MSAKVYTVVTAQLAVFDVGVSDIMLVCADWDFDVSNAIEATDSHFNVQIHENWGQQEVDDLVAALVKIESAYAVESYAVESADAASVAQVSAVATSASAAPRPRL